MKEMDWILSFIKVKREAKVNVSLTCSTILGKITWKNNVHQSNPSVPYMDNVRQYSLIAFLATFRDNALVMFIGTWFQILAAFTEKLLSDTFLREASSNTLHKLGLSCLLLSMNCLNKMAISFRFPMVWFGMVRTTAIDMTNLSKTKPLEIRT